MGYRNFKYKLVGVGGIMNDSLGINSEDTPVITETPKGLTGSGSNKATIIYAEMTTGDILKKVKITGKFKNKMELCKLAEKQGIEVVYPKSKA